MIFNFGPFFTLLMGFLILGESLPKIEIVNMVISFIGVALVIYSSKGSFDKGEIIYESKFQYFFSVGLVIFGAIMTSFVGIIVKKLKDVHVSVVNTILGLELLIVSIPIWFIGRYRVSESIEYNFTEFQWILIILVGILAALGNMLMVIAFTLDKVSRIHSIFFILVFLGYIEDILLFHINLHLLDILGSSLIIVGSCVIFVLKYLDYY